MEIDHVESLAQAAAGRYRRFALALRGLYAEAIDADPSAARTRDHLSARTAQLFTQMSIDEEQHVGRHSIEVAGYAISDALRALSVPDLPGLTRANLYELAQRAAQDTTDSLDRQFVRDVREIERAVHEIGLRASILATARNWSLRAAVIALREQQSQQDRFRYVDSAGRRIKGERFVYLQVRGHYLTVYNETYLNVLATFGVNRARVEHVESAHVHHQRRFRIFEDETDLPLYAAIREEVFHPQARALVSVE